MEKFKHILQKAFAQDIISQGGKIYFVGGSVRDHFLNKEPKDIDLVVGNLPLIELKTLLQKYGFVDVVGEAFGVIVFKEMGGGVLSLFESAPPTGFSAEIALPRIDSLDKTKKGHTAIIAQSDPYLPIEIDLKRRDFTINSIAIDQDMNVIDPYDGLVDLKNQLIKATDKNAFVDDPLRILRAIQFAARFSFDIEVETHNMILEHSHLIKEIKPERILMEFQKVFDKKANIVNFYNKLSNTTILDELFIFSFCAVSTIELEGVKYLSEFLYLLIKNTMENGFGDGYNLTGWNAFYLKHLKIDKKTFSELRVLEILYHAKLEKKTALQKKHIIFTCLLIAPWLWDSKFFYLKGIDKQKFDNDIYPKSYKHLAVTGDDMILMGFEEGVHMGKVRSEILNLILDDKLSNTKEEIIEWLAKKLKVLS